MNGRHDSTNGRGVPGRPSLAVCSGLLLIAACTTASADTAPGTLELHFLNSTVEEGSWSSEELAHADLKPLCGEIEIHATYSGMTQALRIVVNGEEVDRQAGADVRLHWDTRGWPDGEHRVAFEALGEKDETVATFELTLETTTEQDREPPVVRITFPPPDAIVRGVVVIKVEARDDHAVVLVRMLLDGDPVAEQTQFPYTFSWDTRKTTRGSRHRLQAEASDKAGNVGSSDPIDVTASNPVGLVRNPTLIGVPPGSWRLVGGALLEPGSDVERGAYLRVSLPPGVQEPGGLEQEITLDSEVVGAVVALTARPPLPVGEGSSPACRLTLLREGGDVIATATAGGDRATTGKWNETTVPLPLLGPGRYLLRFALAPAASGVVSCDVARTDMVVP